MKKIEIMRMSAVLEQTGYPSHSSIYVAMKEGTFPKQVNIGVRSMGWPNYEVQAINAARIAGYSEDQLKELVNRLHANRIALGESLSAALDASAGQLILTMDEQPQPEQPDHIDDVVPQSVEKSWLNFLNKAIVRFVAKSGSAGFDALYDVFGEPIANNKSRKLLHARLSWLKHYDHLASTLQAGKETYRLGIKHQVPSEPEATQTEKKLQKVELEIPELQEQIRDEKQLTAFPNMTAVRTGAQDFQHCPSHGTNC